LATRGAFAGESLRAGERARRAGAVVLLPAACDGVEVRQARERQATVRLERFIY
jgi:hypothetical protein